MSNQRPAKKQSRPDILGQDMGILKFFKIAQKVLEKEKKEDEAFNMEMMVDWLQSGKRLPNTEEDVIKRNEYQEDKSWIHQQQDSRHNQW